MPVSQRLSFTFSRTVRVAALSLLSPVLALASAGCTDHEAQRSPVNPGAGTGEPGAESRPQGSGTTGSSGDTATPESGGEGTQPEENPGEGGLPGPDGDPEGRDKGKKEADPSQDGSAAADRESKDPAKLLEEADVVKLQGDRAFVLSELSGFHILDLADPTNIKILGSKPLDGAPFEMHVRDEEVLVLTRDLYFFDAASKSWKTGSAALRLNVKDPSKIEVLEQSRVLGRLSDSRMINDRLYWVSYEDGDCFECASESQVRLSSVLAPKGGALSKVDEQVFGSDFRFGRAPSAYFVKDEVFITAPSNRKPPEKGTLFRAKMNDSNGDLEAYPAINFAGGVLHRWQINQHEDVLRVISLGLEFDANPMLETFKLEGKKVTPLAVLDIDLPGYADSKNAYFDGERAYLRTSRRQDPLFTFDLRDPSKPKQIGEIKLPGRVFDIEARGNRLLGLGYDIKDPKNRLSLTLFDVSDLAKPQVLSQVHFGGTKVSFAEGELRNRRALNLVEDQDLILVPYLNYDPMKRGRDEDSDEGDVEESEEGFAPAAIPRPVRGDRDCEIWDRSVIQLVDWKDHEVKLRGLASVVGGAHRSILRGDQLLAFSGSGATVFNIEDRDRPKRLGQKETALFTSHLEAMGEHTVRLSSGWSGNGLELQVVRKDAADELGFVSSIPLSSLTPGSCKDARYLEVLHLFAEGEHLYVLFTDVADAITTPKIAVVNLRDPAKPKFVGTKTIEQGSKEADSALKEFKVHSKSFGVLGDRVVLARFDQRRDKERNRDVTKTVFTVLRLDPKQGLVEEASLDRNSTDYAGGLIPAGEELGSWHARKTDAKGPLKFFYDRFFIDETGRFQHQAIEVPGVPLGRESAHKRLMTMNFRLERVDSDAESCKKQVKFHEWDERDSKCVLINTSLTQLELSETGETKTIHEIDLAGPQYALHLAFLHEDRVYWTARGPQGEGGVRGVAALDAAGTLKQARFESAQTPGRLRPLNGGQAIETISRAQVGVLDGRSVDALGRRLYKTPSHLCRSTLANDNTLYCAMGALGVREALPE